MNVKMLLLLDVLITMIVMVLWLVVMMLLLLAFAVGCNVDWKDHLMNQNHLSMVVVDLYVMEVAAGDLYSDFVVLRGCFVFFVN